MSSPVDTPWSREGVWGAKIGTGRRFLLAEEGVLEANESVILGSHAV